MNRTLLMGINADRRNGEKLILRNNVMLPKSRFARSMLACALLFAGGCAIESHRAAGPSGEARYQEIAITSEGWERRGPDWQQLPPRQTQTLDGVACTLSNDRGAWNVTTPGKVTVELSAAALEVECGKEGYEPARAAIPCVSPTARNAAVGARVGTGLASGAAPALVAAAPPVGIAVLAIAGTVALGAGIGAATAGPVTQLCDYAPRNALHVTLWKK